ncbi:hypothetical protein KN63_08890 [Smithella sp. F21]|jgi:hypothetical protein|nr:hypothetical protein KN63_08890 [Smithella sp. F21]
MALLEKQMKIDMSPEAIAKRLKIVNELRRTCLSLANSSTGKDILKKNSTKSVQRTSRSLGFEGDHAYDVEIVDYH